MLIDIYYDETHVKKTTLKYFFVSLISLMLLLVKIVDFFLYIISYKIKTCFSFNASKNTMLEKLIDGRVGLDQGEKTIFYYHFLSVSIFG